MYLCGELHVIFDGAVDSVERMVSNVALPFYDIIAFLHEPDEQFVKLNLINFLFTNMRNVWSPRSMMADRNNWKETFFLDLWCTDLIKIGLATL